MKIVQTGRGRFEHLTSVDSVLSSLVSRPSTLTVSNPYTGAYGDVRLENYRRYLLHVQALEPAIALIGEAPGYRGCAVTGIPLTSRALLAADLGRWGLFAPTQLAHHEALGPYKNEATATIVWRHVVPLLPSPPLTGNAFPFHPHPEGQATRNRSLTASERDEGAHHLAQLLSLFPRVKVVAIGREAERALERIGVRPIATLRHPAHGGSKSFASGLARLCTDLFALTPYSQKR